MKVLVLLAAPFPSHQGSQLLVDGWCRALVSSGHAVRLLSYPAPGDVPTGVVDRRGTRRWGAVSLRSGPQPGKLIEDAALGLRLRKELRADPPDVIHAHHVEALALALAARAQLGVGVPVVWVPHTALGEELPTYLPVHSGLNLSGRAGDALDAALAPRADACVALSGPGARWLTGLGAKRVVRVPPPVDVSEVLGGDAGAARERWGLGAGDWVLYTGNADGYQELPLLFDAMARLPEVGLLVHSGEGPRRFRSLARRAGLPVTRLRVVGDGLPGLRDALAVSRCAVVPRRRCAGFPMKLLNSLAAGRVTLCDPAIAPPLEGVVPVPMADPDAVAGALAGLLADPEMCGRLGDAGARAVRAAHGQPALKRALKRLHDAL